MFLKSDLGSPKGLPGYREFARSALVSLLSFALDFFVCMLIVERTGMNYLVAMTISFTLGTVLNYILSILWIFGRGPGRWHMEFLAFLGTAGIGLVLNGMAMFCFTGLFRIHYLISRVLSSTLVFFFNFACRKFLIFADGEKGLVAWIRHHGAKFREKHSPPRQNPSS